MNAASFVGPTRPPGPRPPPIYSGGSNCACVTLCVGASLVGRRRRVKMSQYSGMVSARLRARASNQDTCFLKTLFVACRVGVRACACVSPEFEFQKVQFEVFFILKRGCGAPGDVQTPQVHQDCRPQPHFGPLTSDPAAFRICCCWEFSFLSHLCDVVFVSPDHLLRGEVFHWKEAGGPRRM